MNSSANAGVFHGKFHSKYNAGFSKVNALGKDGINWIETKLLIIRMMLNYMGGYWSFSENPLSLNYFFFKFDSF